MIKKLFTSTKSFDDAKFKAKMAGFKVVGGSMKNKKGQYVVFARK